MVIDVAKWCGLKDGMIGMLERLFGSRGLYGLYMDPVSKNEAYFMFALQSQK
jgi:hypothetical protein